MKKLLLALGLLAFTATALPQQGTVRFHTNPKLPSRDLLDRLNLTRAWATKVPVDGLHDGFYTLQLIPGKNFTLLVAQTFKGAVVAINADTGDTLWRTTVGLPYRSMQPVGANDQAIFVCRHETLFVLDREDGKQLLYTIDESSNLPDYGVQLQAPPTAAMVADNKWMFASFGDRLVRFAIPDFRAALKQPPPGAEPGAKRQPSPQLLREWIFPTGGSLSQAPVLARATVTVTTDGGTALVVSKSHIVDDTADFLFDYKTDGPVIAAVGWHQAMIYIPSQDYFLHAFDTATGRPSWRFAGQAPLDSAPRVTDPDVFVKAKSGLNRLDRASGNSLWSSKDAVKFLATNQRFVYARDRVGNMLVLDYERGKCLAAWDARDWVLSIPNELTDRIYLAAHNGQIVCLHHRDFTKPLKVKTFELPPPKIKAPPKKKDADQQPPGDDVMPKDKGPNGKDKDKDKDKGGLDPLSSLGFGRSPAEVGSVECGDLSPLLRDRNREESFVPKKRRQVAALQRSSM